MRTYIHYYAYRNQAPPRVCCVSRKGDGVGKKYRLYQWNLRCAAAVAAGMSSQLKFLY
jgi:hypothetical protein